MDTYTLHQGTAPLFISLPHNGTRVPDDLLERLQEAMSLAGRDEALKRIDAALIKSGTTA